MLYYFANDYYSSNGYPSTIGKHTFMKLYFGTANVDEAVRDTLMVSDAMNAFFSDFTEHGFTGDVFYENLVNYANGVYDKYYSLTATGLKVYVDFDEDGEADKLDPTSDAEIIALAEELLEKAYDVVAHSHTDYATAVSNVVTDYKESTRTVNAENETTPEYNWAKYRFAGLYLETTEIGEVTNSTTTVDAVIQERIEPSWMAPPRAALSLPWPISCRYR